MHDTIMVDNDIMHWSKARGQSVVFICLVFVSSSWTRASETLQVSSDNVRLCYANEVANGRVKGALDSFVMEAGCQKDQACD